MSNPPELPPLPKPEYSNATWADRYSDMEEGFTAEQMTAYGKQCALAQMERDAALCEAQFPSECYDPEKTIEEMAFEACAATIRKQALALSDSSPTIPPND